MLISAVNNMKLWVKTYIRFQNISLKFNNFVISI